MNLIRIIFFAMLCLLMMSTPAAAQSKKILYVPLDSRPCNFFQVVQVADKLGYEILTPPAEFLGNRENRGDIDKMWQWLNENAPQAEFAILSTDALIYGSLVASRLQDLDPPDIMARAKRFEDFDKKFPYLQIYAFATIMRTPRGVSYPGIEPDYYATYGPQIFQYTALLDKQETQKLSGRELRTLKKFKAEIPAEYLQDWLERREENFDANKYLIDLTRRGVFEYFLLGCDDSALFGQTHMESRHLAEYGKDLGKTVMQVTSGADELGMLMVARAINDHRDFMPFISVVYNDGVGAKTFPTYCNEPIGVSIDAAIVAAGCLKVPSHDKADLVVVVNTHSNGKTLEATTKRNSLKLRGDLKKFMRKLNDLTAKYPVAVADIAFANGADNALINQLKQSDLLYKIRAYGGWNTATNATGFLIGAGSLTGAMTDKDVAELLTTRYLDDWAYEANVRQEVIGACYGLAGDGNIWNLKDKLPTLEQLLNKRMKEFAAENLTLPRRYRLENLRVSFPWQRTFECDPRFELAD